VKEVSLITKHELQGRLSDFVVRTERGNAVVRRNPRELPRRLRVLLLAVDGTHTVQLYVQTLKGFGDIAELLVELSALGLVQLRTPQETQAAAARESQSQFSALNDLLDDTRFDSKIAADVLYGSTSAGSFDEMLRVAKIEIPGFKPPPPAPPPAPVSPAVQRAQIESLFELLDAVRGERRNLKKQLAKMERIRAAAIRLDNENQRLYRNAFALGTVCFALLVSLVLVVVRH
jgi:hypothetical protein